MRIPKHIGIIPDGNRRWAAAENLKKHEGYSHGLNPGIESFRYLNQLGAEEITYYGFTADNTKRPSEQRIAFTKACVEAVEMIKKEDSEIYVCGNYNSKMFPPELTDLTQRKKFNNGGIKVNFLINYSWQWDLNFNSESANAFNSKSISRVDLIIRWGGMRRLSGFLPIQSVYADFYVVDNLWPDYKNEDIDNALNWYQKQDITLGG